jgi:predicted DNA-binding transcriptional regulator YafY
VHALERLVRIYDEIRLGRHPTKADLARLVERNERTVQRDLEALRRLGAPLEFDRSKNGFYFVNPDWKLPVMTLTKGELISFFAAERVLRRLGAATAEIKLARDAVRSLARRLPAEVSVDLNSLAEAISIAPDQALDASPDVLQQLTAAAAARETLRVKYISQSRGGVATEREIDVLLLHNNLGEWYAISFDHLSREVRDFHAGRMREVERTGKRFAQPAGWNAEGYLRKGFGMFRGGEVVTVEVEFDADQARYVRERKYHETQENRELGDGRLGVRFETTEAALGQVARWLLQYGEHAVVLRPLQLREMVRERFKRAAKLYDSLLDE